MYAAVMAIGGSFRNSNYMEYPISDGANLILRGALIQKRGAVGNVAMLWFPKETGYKRLCSRSRMMSEQPLIS